MKAPRKIFIHVLLFILCVSALGMLAYRRENTVSAKQDQPVSVEEFKRRTNQHEKPVLVYFSASWCAVCKKVGPVVEELEGEYGKNLDVLKIDTDRDKALSEELEIDALPVLMFYKKGVRQWIHVGLIDKTKLKSQIGS